MEEVIEGGIYKHFKGEYYRVITVAYCCGGGPTIVVYNRCTEDGIFKSIRERKVISLDDNNTTSEGRIVESIVKQPFYRNLEAFTDFTLDKKQKRFTFVRKL